MEIKHKQIIEQLTPFVKQVSGKTATKAVVDMARNLAGALAESEVSVDKYKNGYENDMIFDPVCLLGNHLDIFNFAKPGFVEFCKVMFQLRPIGLGTPNAMIGEGEFMALFCSPRAGIAKKQGFGDITVDDKNIELKGAEMRIMGKISGVDVQQHANTIAEKYGVVANKCNKNRTAFEPWEVDKSRQKIEHWIEQFNNLGVESSCRYLNELCSCFMQCGIGDFLRCFNRSGEFNSEIFRRFILKKLFAEMDKKWDFFTVIDEGKITCLPNDVQVFSDMVDAGKIEVTENYFRSFQKYNVGLYVKLI